MLNLYLSSCVVLQPNPHLFECKAISVDSYSDAVWVINKDLVLLRIEVSNTSNKVVIVNDLKESQELSSDDSIIGMECLAEMNVLAVATRNGDMLSISTVPPNEVEGVGCVSDGFLCMSWSPDQDVVAMVTGSNCILMMTREFDPVLEVSIDSEEFGEAQPITVGWGKKETQFHGSLGKQSAKQPISDKVSPAVPWDDHSPVISWRGDGEFFACSTIDPTSGARKFRVWRRDGMKLYSTSEPTQGLERPLSWRPSGNLIACCQRKPHRYDVIFYEPNGLRHGEFVLFNDSQTDWMVVELQWNTDSTVLGVWLEHKTSPKNTTIQLWTTKNYHWYLKQEFCPLSEHTDKSALTSMIWDPITPLKLHLLTTGGQYIAYTWCQRVSTSDHTDVTNDGAVTVIDGANVLWTPFRHVNIPPPMCAHQLTVPSAVLAIAYSPPPRSNDFVILTSKGFIVFVKSENCTEQVEGMRSGFRSMTVTPIVQAVSHRVILKELHFNIHDLRWLVWLQEDTLLGISSRSCDQSQDTMTDVIVEYSISNNCLLERTVTPCDGHVICCHANSNTGTVAVELQDGSVYSYKDFSLKPWESCLGDHVSFNGVSCDQISLATFSDKECIIGLNTSRRQLFIDNMKVSSSCTSFTVHNDFILFTTDAHVLRVISTCCVSSSLKDINMDDTNVTDESLRRVERGSRIITSIPNDYRVILQMPRGNLETICPRALVLARVRYCLDKLLFKEAFLIMRKHRLNLNFICDHNLTRFIDNARLFIEQINDVNFINLFLTELKSEDVTSTMYPTPSWYQSRSSTVTNPVAIASKVNSICDSLRPILVELDEAKYCLSIITTHVKKTPQELEEVLCILKKLKDMVPHGSESGTVPHGSESGTVPHGSESGTVPHGSESESDGSIPQVSSVISVDEAIKYVLLLVDVNDLYDVALGMYDFDLVIMVALKSQKDPKEYLPFLNELKKLPVHYQRYKIDHYLKKYEKALISIFQCGSEKFDECLLFIKEFKLYKQALNLYTDKESHDHHVISLMYADYLAEAGSHKDAAIIYTRCGQLEKALVCYEKADMWQQVMVTCIMIDEDDPHRTSVIGRKTLSVYPRIVDKLKSQGRYFEAATVLISYNDDPYEGVKVLIEGKEWVEAVRLIYCHRFHKLIEECLKPSLLDAHQAQMSLIEQQLLTFNRHADRLKVVREKKAEKAASILDGTFVADEKDADLFSDLTSVTGISSVASSKLSRVSNKTAKSRKKAERKKYSLKEGSANEDIALLEELKQITELGNKLCGETGTLLHVLTIFGFETQARELQENFDAFLNTIQGRHKEIWPPLINQSGAQQFVTSNFIAGPSSTVNDIVTTLKAQQMTSHNNVLSVPILPKDESWKLKVL